MSEILLENIWKPKPATSRYHESLRQELLAAINSLDEIDCITARDILAALFNTPAPKDFGTSYRRDEQGRVVRYTAKSEIAHG